MNMKKQKFIKEDNDEDDVEMKMIIEEEEEEIEILTDIYESKRKKVLNKKMNIINEIEELSKEVSG